MAEREEQEGGKRRGDKRYKTQTAGRTIWYRDDGSQWAEEGHQRLTAKAAFFYSDNGVVSSTDPGWLQLVFDFLTGLFDRVGLRTNVCKTMGIVCRPFQAAGVQAEESYTRRMTGEGRSFKERQGERQRERIS